MVCFNGLLTNQSATKITLNTTLIWKLNTFLHIMKTCVHAHHAHTHTCTHTWMRTPTHHHHHRYYPSQPRLEPQPQTRESSIIRCSLTSIWFPIVRVGHLICIHKKVLLHWRYILHWKSPRTDQSGDLNGILTTPAKPTPPKNTDVIGMHHCDGPVLGRDILYYRNLSVWKVKAIEQWNVIDRQIFYAT